MPSLDLALAPLEIALSTVLVAAHAGLVAAGMPAASGVTWAVSIATLVVTVRLALAPLVVRQLRTARRLAADAEGSPWGCLPLLLQAPVLLALFRVLNAVARGQAVGAVGPALVAQLDGATLAGASLTQTLLAGGPATAVALALVAATAAALWLAQHRQLTLNTPPAALAGPTGTAQRLLRWVIPATAIIPGLTLPIGLLVYVACANALSLLQQLAVIRWFPTPGSPAATRT